MVYFVRSAGFEERIEAENEEAAATEMLREACKDGVVALSEYTLVSSTPFTEVCSEVSMFTTSTLLESLGIEIEPKIPLMRLIRAED
jgi:hypothetical protein